MSVAGTSRSSKEPSVLSKEKKSDPATKKVGKLGSLSASTTMDNKLLREKIERMEAGRPFVQWRSRQ
ncbi:hypothetical protein [Thioalkalivibrio sp. HK1]|uniref:hypothetical protein n=1 Tax=Thioalkalivibrio sp. HK1 TaxID=1469245 RepID=UPI0012DE5FE0|nr:hypothetical protein [Thioalkalivibrio sp. HK1]